MVADTPTSPEHGEFPLRTWLDFEIEPDGDGRSLAWLDIADRHLTVPIQDLPARHRIGRRLVARPHREILPDQVGDAQRDPGTRRGGGRQVRRVALRRGVPGCQGLGALSLGLEGARQGGRRARGGEHSRCQHRLDLYINGRGRCRDV